MLASANTGNDRQTIKPQGPNRSTHEIVSAIVSSLENFLTNRGPNQRESKYPNSADRFNPIQQTNTPVMLPRIAPAKVHTTLLGTGISKSTTSKPTTANENCIGFSLSHFDSIHCSTQGSNWFAQTRNGTMGINKTQTIKNANFQRLFNGSRNVL